jgi:inosose dehydratase
MAAAGYAGIELGPLGYLPTAPRVTHDELSARDLDVAAGHVMEPFHDLDSLAAVESLTRDTCRVLADLGAHTLVLITGLSPDRIATAGRSTDAVRLDTDRWRELVGAIERLAALARDEFGLRAAFHPHVGTPVEFEDEIERLLADTDPALVGLCIDTGHCVYAGVNPVDLCRRHRNRLAHLHLKDVDPDVLQDVRVRRVDFVAAVAESVFCRLGRGTVDFQAFLAAVAAARYDGWATVEQDRLPTASTTPSMDARAGLEHLMAIEPLATTKGYS